MTETLLPCPFCGGAPKLRTHRSGEDAMEAYVECPSCEVRTTYYEDAYAPTADAISSWNRRMRLPQANVDGRIAELEAELADARLEIEGILARKKTPGAPSRASCEEAAARIAAIDEHASELLSLLPYYIDNAATWRGIAAAMGYEPLAHKDARPVGQWLNDRIAMFRANIIAAATLAPAQPDYCFDPAEWEFTCDWSDRDQVHGHGEGLNHGEPMRVCTLMKGPDKWVADVPVTWDEHGDPDETEIKWFDSEEEARAALTTTDGSADAS